jgi:OPA family glycerol-3-phosphate transporter-like MFS transporter 1/2
MGIITAEVKIRQDKMEAKRKEMAEKGEAMAEDEGPAPISYRAALGIPMVAQYAFAFGFFKLTNYVLFFWLPYFLGKSFDPVTANLIAALYSVGMMPGGIIVGFVSDIFGGRRASVIGTFMCSLIVFLAIFSIYSESLSPGVLLVMLGCMGILVGGYVMNHGDALNSLTRLFSCRFLRFSYLVQTTLSLPPLPLTWLPTRRSAETISLLVR